jgi:PAS domain S-box-containing protein
MPHYDPDPAPETDALFRLLVDAVGDYAIFMIDPQGRVVSWNRGAERIKGYTAADVIGQHFSRFYLTEDVVAGNPARALAIAAAAGRYAEEGWRVRQDGSRFWASATITAVSDATGALKGFAKVTHDLTERRRADEALHRAAQFPAENPNPVLRIARGGDVLYANPPARTLLRDEGCDGGPPVAAALREACSAVLDGTPHHLDVRCRDGRIFSFDCVAVPASGHVNVYGRDVTEARRAEEELRRSEETLAQAGEMADLGAWWTDIDDPDDLDANPLHWSDHVYRIFGYEPGGVVVTRDLFYERVHPDDRTRVSEGMARAMVEKRPYGLEHRIVRPDGTERVVQEHGQIVHDDRGRPRRLVGAVQDVTERRRIEDELRAARRSAEEAKARAEEANRAKDHFLAVLSHELRTPLTPVLTGIALIQKDATVPARAREYLEVARRNVELESRLIDDLLDLTRIARGKLEVDKRRFDLCTIIQRAVEVCRADIDARRLHFGVDLGPGPYVVEADAARLQQVFWNLLKNAVKFTPHGGCVGVRCRPEGHTVVVEVTDSGIGIEPSDLGRIFDAFTQARGSSAPRFGGLGLGLTISRALVETHGGVLEAASEGVNKGATFTVRLPIAAASTSSRVEVAAGAPALDAVRPGELRVLLVEDHGDTARMITLVLEARGHRVRTAGDVATALATATEETFDVLVTDLGLPDGSGLEILRELRARGHTELPAIAVSGYGHEHDIERSRAAGFVVHLVKPVDPDRLLDALERAAGP